MIFSQIFETINTGLVVLDKDIRVQHWNRWMALHSQIEQQEIVGKSLFEFYPELDSAHFRRSCRTVLAFGHFCFFSQKLHKYLFPMPPAGSLAEEFDHMQQSCTMGPLRNAEGAIERLYLSVQDVSEVVSYQKKLVRMNQIDPLTGVYNRNFMESQLEKEVVRCQRFNHDLSLLMIDVDLFKTVNDSYGHQCGDFALKELTQRLLKKIRQTDFLIRYGGDEFCCLLTETSPEKAVHVAEILRQQVCARPFFFRGTEFNVTISIGVAGFDETDIDVESLLRKADSALYQAKQSGRNTVVNTFS